MVKRRTHKVRRKVRRSVNRLKRTRKTRKTRKTRRKKLLVGGVLSFNKKRSRHLGIPNADPYNDIINLLYSDFTIEDLNTAGIESADTLITSVYSDLSKKIAESWVALDTVIPLNDISSDELEEIKIIQKLSNEKFYELLMLCDRHKSYEKLEILLTVDLPTLRMINEKLGIPMKETIIIEYLEIVRRTLL